MNRRDSHKILWREWASCDVEGDGYLDTVFGLVEDSRAGAGGAMVMGLLLALWAPLATWPAACFFSAVAAYSLSYSVVWALKAGGAAMTTTTFSCAFAGLVLGGICRWRSNLAVLATLRWGLLPYVCIGRPLADPPYDNVVVRLSIGTTAFAVVITALLGVCYLVDSVDADLGVWGRLAMWTSLLIAGTISLLPIAMVLSGAVGLCNGKGPKVDSIRRYCLWWRPRPHYLELESALAACGSDEIKQMISRVQSTTLDVDAVRKWIERLQSTLWQERFSARHVCLRYGGQAVESLDLDHSGPATRLLETICEDTASRLKTGRFLCPDCLCRIVRHQVRDRRFWGCRRCRRSYKLLAYRGHAVAVLDTSSKSKVEVVGGNVCVSWLLHRECFDFDRVRIVAATDEEVETFGTQVRNETDPVRRKLLAKATCRISAGCTLRENTVRILRQTFRRVTVDSKKVCSSFRFAAATRIGRGDVNRDLRGPSRKDKAYGRKTLFGYRARA